MSYSQDKLNKFKDIFLQRRDFLLQSNAKKGNLDLESSDEMDFAQNITIKDIEKNLFDRNSQQVSILNKALCKIEEGTFGDCEECGEEITESRLQALPTCRLCINCAENEERLRKQYRPGAR